MAEENRAPVPQVFATRNDSIPKDIDWGEVENRKLVEKKFLALTQFSQDLVSPYKVKLQICDLFITIISSQKIPEELLVFQSDSPRNDLNIFWRDISESGFHLSEFEYESSQETVLFHLKMSEVAIQRDFCAIKEGRDVRLIASFEMADGLQNLLRTFIPRILISQQKFLLHASSVVLPNGEAIAFMGPSGVGKSTIYSNAPWKSTLHDDMNILSFNQEAKVYIRGAELGSILAKQTIELRKSYPLTHLYLLEQGLENQFIPLARAEAMTAVMANLANYFWSTLSPTEVEQLMSFTHRLVSLVPVYRFINRADQEVWQLLKAHHGLD